VATPGLEKPLHAEMLVHGFAALREVQGGVAFDGTWHDVWRANLQLRGCGKVLARIASFHATHLSQLDKRARTVPWAEHFRKGMPVQIEAVCRKSKIYHSGAAAQRIADAAREEGGLTISYDADVTLMTRIERDHVTISIDTSGDLLHKRGSKQAMAKAPMRETMAAMFLRECGYARGETMVDPMCGSGTFVIEAAEIAAGLKPGRNRHFAFESLKTFDARVWDGMKEFETDLPAHDGESQTKIQCFGSDRDTGAIRAANANAKRAGVERLTTFQQLTIADLQAPEGPPGLVITNPPYGTRIGDKKPLRDLYATFGKVMGERFKGWRVGLVTSDETLARATGLRLRKGAPVLHGGLRIYLFQGAIV
jgi:putative N6-adenine-specific DNA methylase